VLAAEDSARQMFSGNHTDDYYLQALKKSNARWDTALSKLSAHAYLPKELHRDTLKLRHYIKWNKKENLFRITMIERESYIYLDSIELAQDSIRSFMRLDYPLVMTLSDKKEEPEDKGPVYETVQVFYNAEWEEVPGEPFSYYRIGTRDSLGRWQGRLQDYYANSDVQMKGSYKNDERDGIFIYYSDHKTYQSAGRYRADRSVGKWETYHNNGVLESEVYYTDRYFLKNLWDSTGKQLVKDGYGKVKEQYPNGVVSNEGEYRDGYKEGYWYGRHPSGKMYYEENYYRGRLVNGRSKNVEGETFVYDESSLFPLPVGGYKNLKEYIQGAVKQTNERVRGTVRLSFRVTSTGRLTDFKVLQSISKQADDQAKQIIKSGPQWIPAKNHGCENVDGFAFVDVEFS
jgi:TonB family protein